MKQIIIDLLKTKFEGVDESILSRIADTKAAKSVKTEEDATTFVEGVTLNQLLTSYADIRSTEAQRTAIVNYEKKHGIKDGKRVIEGDPNALGEDDNNDDGMPAWAKRLFDENKKLNEQVAAINADKLNASRKERFDAIINRLPEHSRKGYARTSYKELSDEGFDTLLAEVSNEVEATLKEAKTNGITFGSPYQRTQGAQHGASEKATKEEVAKVTEGW